MAVPIHRTELWTAQLKDLKCPLPLPRPCWPPPSAIPDHCHHRAPSPHLAGCCRTSLEPPHHKPPPPMLEPQSLELGEAMAMPSFPFSSPSRSHRSHHPELSCCSSPFGEDAGSHHGHVVPPLVIPTLAHHGQSMKKAHGPEHPSSFPVSVQVHCPTLQSPVAAVSPSPVVARPSAWKHHRRAKCRKILSKSLIPYHHASPSLFLCQAAHPLPLFSSKLLPKPQPSITMAGPWEKSMDRHTTGQGSQPMPRPPSSSSSLPTMLSSHAAGVLHAVPTPKPCSTHFMAKDMAIIS